jgi:mono/diheme cytochrome c family protein
MKTLRSIGVLSVLSVLLTLSSVAAHAQQPAPTVVPGYYQELDSSATALRRGEALFYQRCSLCHLPRIRKDKTTPGPAPSLTGILKGADKDLENSVREVIMKGSLRMPGWQYALKPAQMDELITYLKTL